MKITNAVKKAFTDMLSLVRFCSLCFFLGFSAMAGAVCAGNVLGVVVAIGYQNDNETVNEH